MNPQISVTVRSRTKRDARGRREDQPILIERTKDAELIRSIITRPSIYRHLADDGSPQVERYDPTALAAHPLVYFLLASQHGKPGGLWIFASRNAITFELNLGALEHFYGERTRLATKASIRWMFANTHLLRPRTILLAGFDSLWCGTPRGQPYRRADGCDIENQVDIDYHREKLLLPKIERAFDVSIQLLPELESTGTDDEGAARASQAAGLAAARAQAL